MSPLRTVDYRRGIRKITPLPISNVAATTPLTLYQLTPGRTAVIKKIHVVNRNAATTLLQIGTGLAAAYVQSIPNIQVLTGMDLQLAEDQIVAVEFVADITMQVTAAAAAPNDVLVSVEVEEYQGPTG